MKVVKIDQANAKNWSVAETLTKALTDVQAGERQATKCIVLFLDDRGETYHIGFQQCGFSMSEMVALLEVMKARIINEDMRFGAPP